MKMHQSLTRRASFACLILFMISMMLPTSTPLQAQVAKPTEASSDRQTTQQFTSSPKTLLFASQTSRSNTEQRFRIIGGSGQVIFRSAGISFALPVDFPLTELARSQRMPKLEQRMAIQRFHLRFNS